MNLNATLKAVGLFFLSIFFTVPSFGAGNWYLSTHEAHLRFKLGVNIVARPEKIQVALTEAESCLDQAFKTAGYPQLRVRFRVDSVERLSADEENLLRASIYEPALTAEGEPLSSTQNGAAAHFYNVYISRRISRAHVKEQWTNGIPLSARLAANKAAAAYDECDKIYDEELNPLQLKPQLSEEEKAQLETLRVKYGQTCQKAFELESQLPVFYLPNGSEIYLSSKNLDDLSHTIAHEFLHAWGGLSDRYQFADAKLRQKYASNLMGRDMQCSLLPSQVQAIFRFRSTGMGEVEDH